eukprot:tig00000144_g9154.t1
MERLEALASDRAEEVRRGACAALVALHASAAPRFVGAALALPAEPRAALRKVLAPVLPQLDDEMELYGPGRPAPPRDAAPGPASPPTSPRRRLRLLPRLLAPATAAARAGSATAAELVAAVLTPPREPDSPLYPSPGPASAGRGSASSRKRAMYDLLRLVELCEGGAEEGAWRCQVEGVLAAVAAALGSHDGDLRQLGASVLSRVLAALDDPALAPLAPRFIAALLDAYAGAAGAGDRDAVAALDGGVALVLPRLRLRSCAEALAAALGDERAAAAGEAAHGALRQEHAARLLARVVAREAEAGAAAAARVEPFVGLLMGALVRAFGSAAADVRKATVFALVELWLALGDDFTQELTAHLTNAQLKLVTIYWTRACKARGLPVPEAPAPS